MKVTLFTSDNHRHIYFINLLANFCNELWVVQESKNSFTRKNNEQKISSSIVREYFNKVDEAQNKIFNKKFLDKKNKNIKILPILYGEVSQLSLSYLEAFFVICSFL